MMTDQKGHLLAIMANSILTNYLEASTRHFQTFAARTFLAYQFTWLYQVLLSGFLLPDLGVVEIVKTLHF